MANEHQQWINDPSSGYGGMDNYVASQQARYNEAVASGDMDLVGRLSADAQRVGYNLSAPKQGFDGKAEMAGMQEYLQGASDSYFKQQQAMLESNLTAQISELQSAYQDAVAQGQLSVRDAETQFEEQVKQIQQQAYLDSERTSLYGQQMGLQNSQQMIGLMQGDAARKQSLMNENQVNRDKRINDIKDRMNAITSQKDIAIARANADYRTGLLGASAESQRMYNEGMFGLMSSDYAAKRDQNYAQENLRLQDELTRGQMGVQHGYDLEKMEEGFQNSLRLATHESALMIERMNVQHGLDLEKMSRALQDDIAKMSIQYGHQASLQSQAHQNAMAKVSAEYKMKAQAEVEAYNRELERQLSGVTPGTKEYTVIQGNMERELKSKLTELHAGTVYEAVTAKIIGEYPGDDFVKGEPPMDWTKPRGLFGIPGLTFNDPTGGVMNWFTGYDKKQKEYTEKDTAYDKYKEMIKSVEGFYPW